MTVEPALQHVRMGITHQLIGEQLSRLLEELNEVLAA